MAIVRNKLTAVLIGVMGVGLVDLYARTIELIGNMTNFGLSFSAIPKISQIYDEGDLKAVQRQVRIIRSLALLIAVLGVIVGLIAAPWLSLSLQGSYNQTWAFALLTPAIAFSALTCGESAILKGTRKLKTIAAISALGALCTLLITVPLYFVWGIKGVLPVVVLSCMMLFFLHLRANLKDFPYRLVISRRYLWHKGSPILRLGLAYISAGVLGSGAEMLIRAVMMNSDEGLGVVGLYAAGFTLVVSYARLIFVTMDADYFPRLSVAIHQAQQLNRVVNRQIDVLVLLMAPFLIVFSLFLPLIVDILYTRSFYPVIPMVLCALPFMFFKAIYSPIAYLPLAKGDSKVYFVMEFIYDVFFTLVVIVGYRHAGLMGAGCGLALANFWDLMLLPLVYKRIYGFRFQSATVCRFVIQGLLLFMGLFLATVNAVGVKILGGIVLCTLSLALSWRLLQKEIGLNKRFYSIISQLRNRR